MEERDMTDCELMVMKTAWSSDEPLSMKEITTRVNAEYKRDWKTQTVSTFLARLVKKGFLTMERRGRVFFYHPEVSEEDYGKKEIAKCVNFWGGGRIDKLLAAYAGVRRYTEEEKQCIRELLNELN